MKLTPKQRKFADEYIISGNATQAAKAAGYSEKTAKDIGAENLSKPNVKAYIDEKLAEISSKKTADAKEVMEFLTKSMRGEMDEEVLITLRTVTGVDIMRRERRQIPVKDRIKAAELLGKRYGLFSDKLTLEAPIPVIISGSDELED